jgi:protein-disulfide isomerase
VDVVSNGNAVANVVAAVLIGASIVVGAFLLRSSIDRATEEVRTLRGAIELAAASEKEEAEPERPGRPDPRRRYSVSTEGAPVRGSADAKLAIVEFSDFECPFCNRVNPTLLRVLQEYDDRVRLVWKHLPLSIHRRARDAHLASEAAHRQGKFWEMHDKIFADQRRMSPERYLEYARELGLDIERFERDIADAAVGRKVDSDLAEAARLGVTGTPSFFINGRYISGALPYETFRAVIEDELGTG